MKDFKQQYYIDNVPWQRYFIVDNIEKFNIRFTDTIVFHYDLWYSVFKVYNKSQKYDNKLIISAINVCFRYYKLIKTLYPYNRLCVVIHIKKDKKLLVDYDAWKSVLDLIPNFAVCDDVKFIEYFDRTDCKHIIYGSCNNLNFNQSEYQKWSIIQGRLRVRTMSKAKEENL